MNENLENNGQFKMRLDEEVEEAPIPTHVDELRIEKLSHRVTLISILIPVLIVVVLVIAYLDIKKRVIQTEDTGQMTAESLSKEVESRFETLTKAQRLLEENLARLKDLTDQSVAKVQVNLKKLDDRLKRSNRKMISRKDMQTTTDQLGRNIENMSQSIEELKLQLSQLTTSLQPQISALEKALTENKAQMVQLEGMLTNLDKNKIDKAAMELAVKLEALKIKQVYKAQLEDLQSRLTSIEKKLATQPKAAQPAAVPPSPKPIPQQTPPPAAPPETLEEQTIGR
jgi:DNA segregation ATPase FtsK/SpoIIIE-like protein